MTDQLYHPTSAPAAPPSPLFDMLPICGDGRIYEVVLFDKDGNQHQARHQTQIEHDAGYGWSSWFQTKGNEISAEYEWLGPMASSSIAASTPRPAGALLSPLLMTISATSKCDEMVSPLLGARRHLRAQPVCVLV